MEKIIVAITGASGSVLGIRLLEELKKANIQTVLVMSHAARDVLKQETEYKPANIIRLANEHFEEEDLFAPVASGSYAVHIKAMCIIPCSMKTLSAVANGYSDNLITRAADVCLKEKRKLVIVPRETPFSSIHLGNMLTLSGMGVVIMPPVPAFYTGAATVNDVVDQFIGRVLDQLGVPSDIPKRWGEKNS